MMPRREFTTLGLSAAALAGLQPAAHAADDKHEHGHGMSEMFEKCAKACNDCQRECDACATHCAQLLANGHKDHLTTLGTCRDCADFCSAAAEIVARGGPFAGLICDACANACQRCGKACDKFEDKVMKKCAKECFECEKVCREMVKHVKE
jgi:hypothetical protein